MKVDVPGGVIFPIIESAGLWVVCGCGVPLLALQFELKISQKFGNLLPPKISSIRYTAVSTRFTYISAISPHCIFNFPYLWDFTVRMDLDHVLLRASPYWFKTAVPFWGVVYAVSGIFRHFFFIIIVIIFAVWFIFLLWTIFSVPFRMSRSISSHRRYFRPALSGSVGISVFFHRLLLPARFGSFFWSQTMVSKTRCIIFPVSVFTVFSFPSIAVWISFGIFLLVIFLCFFYKFKRISNRSFILRRLWPLVRWFLSHLCSGHGHLIGFSPSASRPT